MTIIEGRLRVRDALIAVLYGFGPRRAEAAALNAADYDPNSWALHIRAGKGKKARSRIHRPASGRSSKPGFVHAPMHLRVPSKRAHFSARCCVAAMYGCGIWIREPSWRHCSAEPEKQEWRN